ncbi:uncharacterized protein LOC119102455 [Pollicipes pollicipes]|uniref:uncharacterized protein LOC119102455 n=1 Tax=Pollicipes pollicipes TaxID=41117 RepID=UPI0018852CB7|nr:uncharacterized protein LOC119102455 [Pollicipes pollicipes]
MLATAYPYPLRSVGLIRRLRRVLGQQRQNQLLERVALLRAKYAQDARDACRAVRAKLDSKLAAESGEKPAAVGHEKADAAAAECEACTGRAETDSEKAEASTTRQNRLVVLRPEPDQALRDLPHANELYSIPTSLKQALHVIFDLRMEVVRLRKVVMQRTIALAEEQVARANEEMESTRRESRMLDQLDSVFTRVQQSRLLPGERHLKWKSEDFLRAIALRRLCRRSAFAYVRNTLKIPLPSMPSVRSVAVRGRMPVVTERFDELERWWKLRDTGPQKKPEQSAQKDPDGSVASECGPMVSSPTPSPKPPARQRSGGGAKRKARADRPDAPSLKRPARLDSGGGTKRRASADPAEKRRSRPCWEPTNSECAPPSAPG